MNNLRKLIDKSLVKGIDCKVTKDSFICNNCWDGKNHRVPFPVSEVNRKCKIL